MAGFGDKKEKAKNVKAITMSKKVGVFEGSRC